MTDQILEVEKVEQIAGGISHQYNDGSEVLYTSIKEGEFLAPFSRVQNEQYKASQRHAPEDTFLLEIFK